MVRQADGCGTVGFRGIVDAKGRIICEGIRHFERHIARIAALTVRAVVSQSNKGLLLLVHAGYTHPILFIQGLSSPVEVIGGDH